jgi:hypothetical protein
MRITAEILNKLAKDAVDQRAKADRGILAVYLYGSLHTGDPVLGGTADIDLFFIHMEEISVHREIVRISDDVHLDIAHHPRSLYRQAKELRRQPWLGPTVYGSKALYDPQHFFDFTQAAVRGQFYTPENVVARANWFKESARQSWWSLEEGEHEAEIEKVLIYLKAVNHAANAVAVLSGSPLPLRRFLLNFPERSAAIGKPGFYQGLLGLLGDNNIDSESIAAWILEWQKAYKALSGKEIPAKFNPYRLNYYLRPFQALAEDDSWHNTLLPLFTTWTEIVQLLQNQEMTEAWQKTIIYIGLGSVSFSEKISALDKYLDMVEETLEAWGEKNGISV